MPKTSRTVTPQSSGLEGLDLRKSRLAKGLSLEDIAEKTKISIRFLRAIEAEEFETLPGGIFTTSYLKQYASTIGVDESRMLSYYTSKCGAMMNTHEIRPEPAEKTSFLRFFSTAVGR